MTETAKRGGLSPAVPYILAACTAVSVLSTDLITPSIPDFPDDLGTSVRLAQMTVSINLAAYAVAQLVHGPLADAIGRRRLLLLAFCLFAAASVFCALAADIETLLTGRFLQGLFSSVPSVVIVLLIREHYDSRQVLGVMALYGTVLGIAPALGPLVGGYLHVWFGWQAGFWLLALLALATAVAVWRMVPESTHRREALHPVRAVRTYLRLLATPAYLRLSLATALGFGAYFAYVTSASVLFIDELGLPTQRYGLTNIAIISCFILGNMIASRLKDRVTVEQLLGAGFAVMIAAMAVMLGSILAVGPTIGLVVGAMSLYAVGLAFVLAAGPIVVLNHVADLPQGAASALLGSLQLGMSALGGYLAALLYAGSGLPLALVMTGLVVAGAALYGLQLRADRAAQQAG